MKKSLFITLFLSFSLSQVFAQNFKSPDQFLGYSLGENYTFHYKMIEYVKYVAENSDKVQFEQVGTTYEGRPLVLLFVSSLENLKNLESIRLNNLKRAQMESGKADVNAPVIVWLSYNVHGNEAVSTEASMKTLFELASSTDAKILDWLNKTIVIIDPCLNPDGRERYVNSYRQIMGTSPNNDPNAWEHEFAWASGRTNHYFFDLNRDWAWMTQKESQTRIAQYDRWMPQIHVDFHEQGYNEPYYFAPAAEPVHEAITPFQREFQEEIGKNHARYFDQNNWLFFTGQYFDLLYPSYGDSWPSFNGAIGMTYEQGGINGGLTIETETGKNLTLIDRISHHFTTGLSTIEMAATNKTRLVNEFEAYFKKAVNSPDGAFKSYIIKKTDSESFGQLLGFLSKQGIVYESAPVGKTVSGYDYFTDDSGRYKTQSEDVLVDASQPKSTLLRVLFEPKPALSDSVTYDITSWALPWIYGVPVIASNQKISGGSVYQTPKVAELTNLTAQGYIFKWDSFEDAKLLAALIQANIKTRAVNQSTKINGKTFTAGSILVLKADNDDSQLTTKLGKLAQKFGIGLTAIQSGYVEKGLDLGSGDILYMKAPKVGVLTNKPTSSMSVGEVWHFFDQQLKYPVSLIDAGNLNSKNLNKYDVLVLPSGNYSSLKESEISKIEDWTRSGGVLIALGNANNWMSNQKRFGSLKSKKAESDDSANTVLYGNREREDISESIPGAVFKNQIDASHPLGYGFGNFLFNLRLGGGTFELLSDGWNVVKAESKDHISGFVGYKAKKDLNNTLVYGAESFGAGNIVYLTQNPLFRAILYQDKLIMANAIFQVGQTR